MLSDPPGLADLILEEYDVRNAVLMFAALFIANIGTIIADLTATVLKW